MRAKLIEFTADRSTSRAKAWSWNSSLRIAWQSSKSPATATARDIGGAGGGHEAPLHVGDAAFGEHGDDAGVRRGRAKASTAAPPVSPEVAQTMVRTRPRSAEDVVVEPRQDLHRHVLERQRRAVEQLEQEAARGQLLQGRDGRVGEGRVGLGAQIVA